jgi:serine/threonine protein kinase
MVDEATVVQLVGADYKVSFMADAGQKSVYRAVSSANDLVVKFVAIEELDDDGDKVPLSSQEERLRREVRLMGSVNSDYLPSLGPITLSECEHNDLKLLYFSELYIGDKNVKDLIKDSSFTPELLKQFLHDIASALVAYSSFENGFVHRDIKPANIVRSNSTQKFVLIDGGVHLLPSNPTMTLSDAFIGTPRYASPEQLLNGRRSLDPRSDIFSLGVIAYEIAQGSHPFFIKGTDPRDCLKNQSVAKFNPVSRSEYMSFVPIISKMLTQYQHSRYSTPDELLTDVEGLEL